MENGMVINKRKKTRLHIKHVYISKSILKGYLERFYVLVCAMNCNVAYKGSDTRYGIILFLLLPLL